MRILLTGACGFVGSSLARFWIEADPGVEIVGIDNFIRPGSERNRGVLAGLGVRVTHGDLRNRVDLDLAGDFDWVVDAAANPSVLAGMGGGESARAVLDHNLAGTVNLLEFCRQRSAGFILLSTSRVYSIPPLASMVVREEGSRFVPVPAGGLSGVSPEGIGESFSTEPPCSLYGVSKRASELLALEYGAAFGFPVWINRCGVLAGAGQFGRPDQGIVAFWIHSWKEGRPLRYIGFGGGGRQVRDLLHPLDLLTLLRRQVARPHADAPRVVNVSGGVGSSFSLAELSAWCADRFGPARVGAEPADRPFDLPWVVLNAASARSAWNWGPERGRDAVFGEIAAFAEAEPDWIETAGR